MSIGASPGQCGANCLEGIVIRRPGYMFISQQSKKGGGKRSGETNANLPSHNQETFHPDRKSKKPARKPAKAHRHRKTPPGQKNPGKANIIYRKKGKRRKPPFPVKPNTKSNAETCCPRSRANNQQASGITRKKSLWKEGTTWTLGSFYTGPKEEAENLLGNPPRFVN